MRSLYFKFVTNLQILFRPQNAWPPLGKFFFFHFDAVTSILAPGPLLGLLLFKIYISTTPPLWHFLILFRRRRPSRRVSIIHSAMAQWLTVINMWLEVTGLLVYLSSYSLAALVPGLLLSKLVSKISSTLSSYVLQVKKEHLFSSYMRLWMISHISFAFLVMKKKSG
jgi:hypothetical protein